MGGAHTTLWMGRVTPVVERHGGHVVAPQVSKDAQVATSLVQNSAPFRCQTPQNAFRSHFSEKKNNTQSLRALLSAGVDFTVAMGEGQSFIAVFDGWFLTRKYSNGRALRTMNAFDVVKLPTLTYEQRRR